MTETVTLPPIDGKPFLKKTAPSTARHAREALAKMLKENNLGFSVTTARRIDYVNEHGTPEIKEAMNNEQVSVWFAYNYVKRQEALFRILKRLATSPTEAPPQRGCQHEATEIVVK